MFRRSWLTTLFLILIPTLLACTIVKTSSINFTHQKPINTITTTTATTTATPVVTPTPTPDSYRPFQPLLAKVVSSGPVDVTGDQTVPTDALNAANDMLNTMLQHRPDIVLALRYQGTFTAVSSRSEKICDLPYFSQYASSDCQAFGEGGAGGVLGHPVTACDEKNLLAESDDPYQRGSGPYSQNICVHELAHTIMDVGVSQADRGRITRRFLAAKQEGLWNSSDYDMSNELEFWAVMSQFYFSAGPDEPYSPTFTYVANGSDTLKQYDPATWTLLDSIYQGSANLQ